MRSEEEIRNMYNTMIEIQKNCDCEPLKQHEGFRQALWWVLNED